MTLSESARKRIHKLTLRKFDIQIEIKGIEDEIRKARRHI